MIGDVRMARSGKSPVTADEIDPAQQARPGFWRRLLRQPVATISLAFVALVVVCAAFAPWIAPYGPGDIDVKARLLGITAQHWLGTDTLGRDTLSRAIYGARIALWSAIEATAIGAVIGVPVGILVGYLGGWWDRLSMRVVDIVDAVPSLIAAFGIIAILGPGLNSIMIAIGIGFATSYARMSRAVSLGVSQQIYIDATRVLGFSKRKIVLRHILPNVRGPLIVQTSILMGIAVLIEAMLSFLGLGAEPGTATWGGMLQAGRQYQTSQPLLSIVPGVLITLLVLAFNLLGDGLRDALGQESFAAAQKAKGVARRAPDVLEKLRPASTLTADVADSAGDTSTEASLLSVQGLDIVTAKRGSKPVPLLNGVSFDVRRNEVFGIVGESGSGKSLTSLACIGLLPAGVFQTAGSIQLAGQELTTLSSAQWREVHGRRIGIIFQDPMAALSPAHTIGKQISAGLRVHESMSKSVAWSHAAELLDRVGVPDARKRLDDYPHQFSGGMAQRAVIAAALACRPELLIADEPTTALDVTVQRQVLDLLADLRGDFGMSVLLITHDLGVVSENCDRMGVMYAGQVVEIGTAEEIFRRPRHPYTAALLEATPTSGSTVNGRLPALPGAVPPPFAWPVGCRFNPRCTFATERCREEMPELVDSVRCHRAAELELGGVQ